MRLSPHRARRTGSTLLVLALTAGLAALNPVATATATVTDSTVMDAGSPLPAAKPYMGWTSWSMQSSKYPGLNPDGDYSYLTEKNVLKQADALAARLKPYGYEYVNIDAGWWRDMDWKPRFDDYGRQAADPGRFPRGMKAVADDLHAKGLKAGIYLPVGLEKEAYGEGRVPVWNAGDCTTADIVYSDLRTTNGWDSAYKIDFSRPCAQRYIDSQAQLFADWGYDFLKLDGVGPGSFKSGENYDNAADVAAWQKAVAATGRPIHLELSWSLDIGHVADWKRYSNGWRIDTDVECYCNTLVTWENSVEDRWDDTPAWTRHAGPGGWNDPRELRVVHAYRPCGAAARAARRLGRVRIDHRGRRTRWLHRGHALEGRQAGRGHGDQCRRPDDHGGVRGAGTEAHPVTRPVRDAARPGAVKGCVNTLPGSWACCGALPCRSSR